MLLRVVFFVLMALGLIGFGTVAWIATRPPPSAVAAVEPPPAPKKPVLVAAHPLREGDLLKPEDLTVHDVPVPAGASFLPDAPDARRGFAGSMVRRAMAGGEPFNAADIIRPTDHGFLAAVLGPGMRAVTIGVDATSGAAGMVWPGDRVDLILTQAIAEANVAPGRRVAAETVLSDVRVIAIDQPTQGSTPGETRTVTLEVTQAAAERVSVAMRLGRLSLSVRASAGTQPAVATGQSNTTWARDVSPALGNDAPPPEADKVVRVFQGSGEVREFKY